MAWSQTVAWIVFNLSGEATGLCVRWWENGEFHRHDESWDSPLDPDEAESLLRFVLATAG